MEMHQLPDLTVPSIKITKRSVLQLLLVSYYIEVWYRTKNRLCPHSDDRISVHPLIDKLVVAICGVIVLH